MKKRFITHEHALWMDVAIARAWRGEPAPNPHVGAIVVLDGALVGVGHHERAGTDHAEVVALKDASFRARGATLYTTLEPCNHHGRTPPCVDAIQTAGITRVVIGIIDPNPDVTGGGASALRSRGIEVIVGVRETDCLRTIRDWISQLHSSERPARPC